MIDEKFSLPTAGRLNDEFHHSAARAGDCCRRPGNADHRNQPIEQRVLPRAAAAQGELTIDVPAVMAAAVLSALPIFLLYVFGRRQLVARLTAGLGT